MADIAKLLSAVDPTNTINSDTTRIVAFEFTYCTSTSSFPTQYGKSSPTTYMATTRYCYGRKSEHPPPQSKARRPR